VTISTGQRLGAPTSTAELIVTHAPTSDGELTLAGAPAAVGASAGPEAESGSDIALGKRYVHIGSGLELLCVKPGAGPLQFNGSSLELKAAKPLPSSD
jgi:hypothetical protein